MTSIAQLAHYLLSCSGSNDGRGAWFFCLYPFWGVGESALQGKPLPTAMLRSLSALSEPAQLRVLSVCWQKPPCPCHGVLPKPSPPLGGLQWGLASSEMQQHLCLLCKPFWWRSCERSFLFGRAAAHTNLPLFTHFHLSTKPPRQAHVHTCCQCLAVSECHLLAWLNEATREPPVCLFLPLFLVRNHSPAFLHLVELREQGPAGPETLLHAGTCSSDRKLKAGRKELFLSGCLREK